MGPGKHFARGALADHDGAAGLIEVGESLGLAVGGHEGG